MVVVLENILLICLSQSTPDQFGLMRPTLDSSSLIQMEDIIL
jgi:hypothetical protein